MLSRKQRLFLFLEQVWLNNNKKDEKNQPYLELNCDTPSGGDIKYTRLCKMIKINLFNQIIRLCHVHLWLLCLLLRCTEVSWASAGNKAAYTTHKEQPL